MARPGHRRQLLLALVIVLGTLLVAVLARVIDVQRPLLQADLGDDGIYVNPAVVPAGFRGAVADWYWLRAVQYVGRKLEQGRVDLDRGRAVDPRVLAPLLDLTTTLDPRLGAAYEFAAVVLPAVDVEAAVRLARKGIANTVDPAGLYQQLAYIHWQGGDFRAAAAAFREGARVTGAAWMEQTAVRMDAEGGDREMAREMYTRMREQATDDQVRQWASRRLLQVRAFDDRDRIHQVLLDYWRRRGTCADRWADVAADLRRAGLPTARDGAPLDPSATPYLLALGGCAVALDPRSAVPQ